MTYNIIAVPTFKKELKRLVKKYPSLKAELEFLIALLEVNLPKAHPLAIIATKYA